MRYQKIESQIWNDEKFSALSPENQRLFFYLLTSPHNNLIGYYCLKEGYACEDLKATPDEFRKGMAMLMAMGLIMYDEKAQVVLVNNFLKHNPISAPNQKKAFVKEILALPKNNLYQAFASINQRLIDGLPDDHKDALSDAHKEPLVTNQLQSSINNKSITKQLQGLKPEKPEKANGNINSLTETAKEKDSAMEGEGLLEEERVERMKKYYESLSPKEKQNFQYTAKGMASHPNPSREELRMLMVKLYEGAYLNQ